jgi:pimeloyl-ACP methyl ester carboxylesterase
MRASLCAILLALALGGCGDSDNPHLSATCADDWQPAFEVDREAYPFSPHCFEHRLGTVHYVDEGPRDAARTAILFHGNTSWSILWREMIPALVARGYRVIAPDLLGFGLSDQPSFDTFSYLPSAQTDVLEEFVVALDLKNAVFYVQDWGGPIGLGIAGRQPSRVAGLVITNTIAFAVAEEPETFYRLIELSMLAHTLEEAFASNCIAIRANAEQMASAFDPTGGQLFDRIHAQVLAPFIDPDSNAARRPRGCLPTAIMAQSLVDETSFLEEVEAGIRNLNDVPVSLVFSAGDAILGEQHCRIDRDGASCPADLECACDPGLLVEAETCSGTARDPRASAWVCRTPGDETVFPAIDAFTRIVGADRVVGTRNVGGRVRHFTPAYAEARSLLLEALDDIEAAL